VIISDILMQLSRLQEVGITHIVCVKHPGKDVFIRANFPKHFRYLLLYADRVFHCILFELYSIGNVIISYYLFDCLFI